MPRPSDANLTDSGLAPSGSGRVLLVACGALAREILDLIDQNGWTHLDLTCLPAIFHNHPEKIAPGIEAAIRKHQSDYQKIFVVYADCGTGGQLKTVCDTLGVEMLQGPHCYSFFEGNQNFAQRSESEFTAFYLTDFLVRQFDAFVWEPLGLARHPELLGTYFGNYEKLVYQAQTDDPDLTARAQDYAKRMGLQFERRFTGYGDLEVELNNVAST